MRTAVFTIAMMIGLFSGAAFSEENPPPGNRPNRGNFDMEQFRQRMMERMKEQLGVNDEEWKVLQPKLEAVQKLSMQSRMGGMGFGRGRRGGGGGGGEGGTAAPAPAPAADPNRSDVENKTQALRTLVENKDADPKAVAEKVKELREAREKAKIDLKKAQDELRELVTPRQEAQLILMGTLE